jgi:hypothetical protein
MLNVTLYGVPSNGRDDPNFLNDGMKMFANGSFSGIHWTNTTKYTIGDVLITLVPAYGTVFEDINTIRLFHFRHGVGPSWQILDASNTILGETVRVNNFVSLGNTLEEMIDSNEFQSIDLRKITTPSGFSFSGFESIWEIQDQINNDIIFGDGDQYIRETNKSSFFDSSSENSLLTIVSHVFRFPANYWNMSKGSTANFSMTFTNPTKVCIGSMHGKIINTSTINQFNTMKALFGIDDAAITIHEGYGAYGYSGLNDPMTWITAIIPPGTYTNTESIEQYIDRDWNWVVVGLGPIVQ